LILGCDAKTADTNNGHGVVIVVHNALATIRGCHVITRGPKVTARIRGLLFKALHVHIAIAAAGNEIFKALINHERELIPISSVIRIRLDVDIIVVNNGDIRDDKLGQVFDGIVACWGCRIGLTAVEELREVERMLCTLPSSLLRITSSRIPTCWIAAAWLTTTGVACVWLSATVRLAITTGTFLAARGSRIGAIVLWKSWETYLS
jgi:hypothetical protein